MKKYEQQIEILKDAYWFAEHKMVDVAMSLVYDAFNNYTDFYAWYLTETCEYALFDKYFVEWVAKVMILLYNGCCSNDEQIMVNFTAKLLNL